jgi:hypothetical protein
MQHESRGADAGHGEQVEQRRFAERKILDQITQRRSVGGPALGQTFECVLDLRGVEGVLGLFFDPLRGTHRRETNI